MVSSEQFAKYIGGDTGIYSTSEWDFPREALRGVKTQSNSYGVHEPRMHSITLNSDESAVVLQILGKNVQSLQSNARGEELLAELETIEWDVFAAE